MKNRERRFQFESLEERNLLAVTAGLTADIIALPEPTGSKTWEVTTLNDISSDTDNLVSLREAVEWASDGDTISFASNLKGGTIKLTNGHIKITKALTISGYSLLDVNEKIGITISGNNSSRIFYTTVSNGTLILEDMNLINGNAGDGAAGSAIFNSGNLTIEHCEFKGNGASGHSYGGCIRNTTGILKMTDCTMTANKAYLGSAISNKTGTITLTNCSMTSNTASYNGGAIYNEGTADLTYCFIKGNKAQSGGAIRNFGTLRVFNSEISGNTATNLGGGIWCSGTTSAYNCTIAGNTGATGGGIYHDSSESMVLNLFNTIVFGNTQSNSSSASGYRDIYGTASGNNNLSSKTISGDGNITYTSTLAALFVKPSEGNYELAENSKAIDAGNNSYAVDSAGKALQHDLSCNTRISNNIVDIGAYEYQSKPAFDITLTGYSGAYDGTAHGVTLKGVLSSDTVYYSSNGSSFTSTTPLTYTNVGSNKVYVKVVRSGYSAWTGSADVHITARPITVTGTSVSDKIYDGTTTAEINLGTVSGILPQDNIKVTATGSFPNSQIGTYSIPIRYALSGTNTTNYTVPTSETVQASIVAVLTKKISVMVVLSETEPTSSELSVLPASISTIETGSTLYAQVWVKNTDGSSLGITGGYIDLTYTTPQLEYGSYSAGDLFSEKSYLVNSSKNGLLSVYGGCPSVETTDIGVANWTLLGCNTFKVKNAGAITVTAKSPTLNGVETNGMNLTRLTVGALKSSEIEYHSATVTAETRLPLLATPIISKIESGGANRHQVEWNTVPSSQQYELQWSTDNVQWNEMTTLNTSTTVLGLSYGAVVNYRVRALGDGIHYADSEWSAVKSLRVCPMDIDSDGFIGVNDYTLLSSHWLTNPASSNWDCRCDIDGDNFTGPGDWSFLMSNWFKSSDSTPLYYPPARADLPDLEGSLIDSVFEEVFEIF